MTFKKQLTNTFGKLHCSVCNNPAYYKEEFFSGADGKYYVSYKCKRHKAPNKFWLWLYRRKTNKEVK